MTAHMKASTIGESRRANNQPPRLLGNTSRWLATGIGLIIVILFFTIASEDWFTIVNYTMIAAIAALALNVLSGYTGQISLGLAFFMAIGAYTAALLGGTQPTTSLDPQGFQPIGSDLATSSRHRCRRRRRTDWSNGVAAQRILSGYCHTITGIHRTIYFPQSQ